MELPYFRYHPDPLGTGGIVSSEQECFVCKQARGYIYSGVIYTSHADHGVPVCPWCIADGSVQRVLNGAFTDMAAIGGLNKDFSEHVSPEIAQEVAWRTPGFAGWQSEQWFTHCGDAAAFLGIMGYEELMAIGQEPIEAIKADETFKYDSPDEIEDWIHGLDKDGCFIAILFRCLHCGKYGGYMDMC